jgi:hypothetical protein
MENSQFNSEDGKTGRSVLSSRLRAFAVSSVPVATETVSVEQNVYSIDFPPPPPPPRYYLLEEVAKLLRLRPSDVPLRRLGQAEGIGWFRVNGQVRVPESELADWEMRNTLKPSTHRTK